MNTQIARNAATHSSGFRNLAFLVAATIALAVPSVADAKKPEQVFRGEIVVSKSRIPTRAKSANAYISKLKKLRTKRFLEDKKKKSWKIYYSAFFSRPLNDLEVTVKMYDVTGGKKLVNSFEQYMDTRGMTSFNSEMELERQYFGVNRHILMVMESRGRVLASARFSIVGEGEKYTGKVEFSEEDTKGNGNLD